MRTILALFLACCAASAQETPERFRHAYDVRFLTRTVYDFPGPDIGTWSRSSDPSPIGLMVSDDGNSSLCVTGDFLASAVVTNFDSDSWSDDRNSIEFRDGVLYVTQTKDVHKRVAQYLEMLRKRFSRRIVVEAEVFSLSPAAYEAAGVTPGMLTPEQEKALRDAAADPARGSLVTVLRTVAMNGQRVHAADLRLQSFIEDYDIEIAQEAVIADPVTGTAKTGAVLDVRPVLAPDAASVLLETRFTLARPGPMRSFDPGAAPLGTIQLPSREILRSRATVACPVGRTALLCSGNGGPSDKGWVFAVLIRSSLAGDGGADATESTEKRQMRMFDVSLLCADVQDFPGPSFDLDFSDAGSEPTTTFVPPEDAGVGLDVEQVVEILKDNVARDSWSNSRNQISAMGNQVVVVQTPEVLAQIDEFLALAAPQRARMISVEAVVVSMEEATWAARRAALSGAAPAEADLKSLLDAAAKGEGAKIAGAARGMGMNRQRFHCLCGGEMRFVQDDDVEIAERSCATDPVIGSLLQGCILDVRGTLAGDGKKIQLSLRPGYLTAAAPAAFDTKAPHVSKIEKIRTNGLQVRNEPIVPENAWTLAGISSHTDGGRREVLALLVRARSMEAK
ncbi:MAG: hypothetical protein HYY18_12535 [Planctomycetes bacterium]|nr:hypothetical protein [Planctomycetota bacterium]